MKKTVVHFIRKSTQLKASFIQNQILNHINYKPVIIFKYDSKKDDGGFAEFDNDNIPILNLWGDKGFKSKWLYKYPKLITREDVKIINEFLGKHKVSILHFHYGTDAGVYFPFLKQTKIPSIVSFYGYDAFSFPKIFFGYGKRYLKNRVFKYMDAALAMTAEMKNDLLSIGCSEEKIKIHYHGIPADFLDYKRNYNNSKSIINILILSYLDPVKGHIFLLRSLRRLINDGFNNFKLSIVGDGHYQNIIQNEVENIKLNSFVKFLGAVKYNSKDYKKVFDEADIFIHPSVITKDDKEGIPGALVEAMFAGLPVISTYHGGIPYVLENEKTGLLVNEWDVKSLTEAIIKIITEKELRKRLGKAAREYAIKNLDLKQKQVELEQIYDQLLS